MSTNFPATRALLDTAAEYPKSSQYGSVSGFGYSNDQLVALLAELSKHVAVGVHDVHHPGAGVTSLKISVYLTFDRSEYDWDETPEASA